MRKLTSQCQFYRRTHYVDLAVGKTYTFATMREAEKLYAGRILQYVNVIRVWNIGMHVWSCLYEASASELKLSWASEGRGWAESRCLIGLGEVKKISFPDERNCHFVSNFQAYIASFGWACLRLPCHHSYLFINFLSLNGLSKSKRLKIILALGLALGPRPSD